MQIGATGIIFIHLHAFGYKYVRMYYVLPTKIIWIHFPTFRYKYMQLMAHRRLLIHFHTFHEFVGHLPWAIRQNDGFGLKNLSEENLENAHQVSIFEHVYSHFITV